MGLVMLAGVPHTGRVVLRNVQKKSRSIPPGVRNDGANVYNSFRIVKSPHIFPPNEFIRGVIAFVNAVLYIRSASRQTYGE